MDKIILIWRKLEIDFVSYARWLQEGASNHGRINARAKSRVGFPLWGIAKVLLFIYPPSK